MALAVICGAVVLASTAASTAAPRTGELVPSSPALDFGAVPPGGASLQVSVTNAGPRRIEILQTPISGPNASEFAVTGCIGAVLRNKQSCAMTVTFATTATDLRTATLDVEADTDSTSVALSGTGGSQAGGGPATQTQGPAPSEAQPEPEESVVLRRTSGAVLVKLPGSKTFVPLENLRLVPLGTIVDARRGQITLASAADRQGNTQSARFYGGIFLVAQVAAKKEGELITELRLREGNLGACRSRRSRRTSATAAAKPGRSLWGSGKGRFRTKGRYAAAVVRGTDWSVHDRCDGTLTRVRRGLVDVEGPRGNLLKRLRRGQSYLARP